MIKYIKNFFYPLKKTYQQIFNYPKFLISSKDFGDYNTYWDDKRGVDLGTLSDWQKNRADFVLKHIKELKKVSILDIGCGDGSVLKYLKKNADIFQGFGVDTSSVALKKANENGIKTFLGDASNPQFFTRIPDVDFILLFEILEHIVNSEEILQLSLKKAKKSVFFSFPNTGYFIYRLRLLFGKFPIQWRVHPGEHVRFWTNADLEWWLNALGYKNYVIYYYRGIPILNKILPSLFAAGFVVNLKK